MVPLALIVALSLSQTPILDAIFDLRDQANRARSQGNYAQAEKLDRDLLALCKKSLGDDHELTAQAHNNFAATLYFLGKLDEAYDQINRALAIREKKLGDHPLTSNTLAMAAGILTEMGRVSDAEPLIRRALTIRTEKLRPNDPEIGKAVNNLAANLSRQGRLAEAETLFRKALFQARNGANPLLVASYLGNLGVNLTNQGRNVDAEQALREAITLERKHLPDQHPDLAGTLNNLALTLHRQERFADAEKLDREALAIRQMRLKPGHPLIGQSMINLARNLEMLGQYAEAETLERRALAMFRANANLGDSHPLTALALNNLGGTLNRQRKYQEAEQLVRQDLAILLKTRGPKHPSTGTSQSNLAVNLLLQNRLAEAEQFATSAFEGYHAARLLVSHSGLDRVEYSSRHSPALLLAHILILNGKGQRAFETLEDDLGRGLFDDLAGRAARPLTAEERRREETLLGRLALLEKNRKDFPGEKATQWTRDYEAAWQELAEERAQQDKKYGVLQGVSFPLDRIQKQLPQNAAFVAWLGRGGPFGGAGPDRQPWAVVVRAKGQPLWVRLKGTGEAGAWSERDEQLAGLVRKQLERVDVNVDITPLLKALYKQRLEPLLPHLDGVRHLVVLPSPELAGIPLEALGGTHSISYAPSATLFAWLREKPARAKAGDLFGLGDPIFSGQDTTKAPSKLLETMRGLTPKPLPCTRAELESIQRLVERQGGKAVTLFGAAASEKGLASVVGSSLERFRYVHLATHGNPSAQSGMNSYLALSPAHPEQAPEDKLTAGQILRTWKLDADLVTLSACSSGLGQHSGGEGYLGFAQALFCAGSRSLILSQWQVNDYATSLFMVRFYQNVLGQRTGLAGPMSKLAALEETRAWMKSLTHHQASQLVRELPDGAREIARWDDDEHPYAHPNYWAAFILIGDPG